LAYPCQQAAYSTATLALGVPFVAGVIAVRDWLAASLRTRTGLAVLTLIAVAPLCVWGAMTRREGNTEKLVPPAGYRAEIFQITDCPQELAGDRFYGLETLIKLMGENDLKFYQTTTAGLTSGPDGIIGADDVVIVKINYQWDARGGTNTDLLRGLIHLLVNHPAGFTGEVVIGENTQSVSSNDFDRISNNSEDYHQSPVDVVRIFADQGHRVSLSDWSSFRHLEAAEFSQGDPYNGYVVDDYDRDVYGRVSYPKFTTAFGTAISLRDGIWDSDGESYDRDRLKIINVPVLKAHGANYGATACVKHYMGLVTDILDTNSHDAIRYGILGTVMREVGLPDLNILDCIWVNANPGGGPWTGYGSATRLDQLVASTDPVAADIWAVTNILIPAYVANGYSPPWPDPSADPDDPTSNFRVYLDNSMQELLEGGYAVTNDLSNIEVHTKVGTRISPEPRRPTRRLSPGG
jgi:hypothetical protein